ncbi:MAG TPA: cyclase family protein [Pyrinomonadaceae bacterium]|jgi:arylformamidase
MRIYDVSVPISSAMPTYPGDPGVEFEQWAALEKGDAANVTMLHFGAHTGTHVDAPAHFIAGAPQVKSLSLENLIGRARVIEMSNDVRAIEASHVMTGKLEGVTRVLFKTRNSDFWSSADKSFRTDFTYIAPDAAHALCESGVRLVGIDYLSVEKFGSKDFQTHLTLLERGVVIIEGLDLREVSAGDYELLCLPLRLADGTGDGAPARVVLRTLE